MKVKKKRSSLPPSLPKCPVCVAFDEQGHALLLYCKRWTCPHCARVLAQRWAKRALAAFVVHPDGKMPEQWFLTLTLSSYYATTEQGFVGLPKLWDKTRKAFQRSMANWQYLAFVEGQPQRGDMPHFHILSAELPPAELGKHRKITKRTLHDWAVGLGWGFEVKLELVDGNLAAFYVAKYASKQSPKTPRGFRRVRCSRDWPKPPDDLVFPVIVRKKGEYRHDYLSRVAVVTGKCMTDLFVEYILANQKLAQILVKR